MNGNQEHVGTSLVADPLFIMGTLNRTGCEATDARTVVACSKPVDFTIWHKRTEAELPDWCAKKHKHRTTLIVCAIGRVSADGQPFINACELTDFASSFACELDGANLNELHDLAEPTMEAIARSVEERFGAAFLARSHAFRLHAIWVSFADSGEGIWHLAARHNAAGVGVA